MIRWIIIIVLLSMAGSAWGGDSLRDASEGCLVSNSPADVILSDTATITVDGCPDSLYVFLYNNLTSGTSEWKGAIYKYSDGALVCTTEVRDIGDEEGTVWMGFEFIDPVTLENGTTYLLSIWAEDLSETHIVCAQANIANYAFTDSETFGAWPSTHAKSATNYRWWSIYVVYDAGSCSSPETPNALHDKSADPTTGSLHDKLYGGSALHEK